MQEAAGRGATFISIPSSLAAGWWFGRCSLAYRFQEGCSYFEFLPGLAAGVASGLSDSGSFGSASGISAKSNLNLSFKLGKWLNTLTSQVKVGLKEIPLLKLLLIEMLLPDMSGGDPAGVMLSGSPSSAQKAHFDNGYLPGRVDKFIRC